MSRRKSQKKVKTPKPQNPKTPEYGVCSKIILDLRFRHNYKNFGVKISYQLFFKKKLETHESPKNPKTPKPQNPKIMNFLKEKKKILQ